MIVLCKSAYSPQQRCALSPHILVTIYLRAQFIVMLSDTNINKPIIDNVPKDTHSPQTTQLDKTVPPKRIVSPLKIKTNSNKNSEDDEGFRSSTISKKQDHVKIFLRYAPNRFSTLDVSNLKNYNPTAQHNKEPIDNFKLDVFKSIVLIKVFRQFSLVVVF